jgi:acetyltransferase EpsM
MKMKICIIGQGGHSKVIIDIINSLNEYDIIAHIDDKFSAIEKKGSIIYGPISLSKQLAKDAEVKFIIAIGDNKIRKGIAEKLNLKVDKFATLIHPSAIISPSAHIGFGTVIMPLVVVNAYSFIGNHVILNTSSVIEHDNQISNYVHISPNSTLTGLVKVKEGTHIGASVTVIPQIQIGKWSIIGAGTTIIRKVEDYKKIVGNPPKEIPYFRRRESK